MTAQPLYKKVKSHIVERIENGSLPMNARAPSEADIVESFGVSRMTANRALNELAKEGLLVRWKTCGALTKKPWCGRWLPAASP